MNAFQNVQSKNGWEGGESNVGDDQSFQHDEASVPASLHFTKRGLASAPAFTSRMESEDEDKYIEVSKLRPRSLGMMTGSQLQKMTLNSVCNLQILWRVEKLSRRRIDFFPREIWLIWSHVAKTFI